MPAIGSLAFSSNRITRRDPETVLDRAVFPTVTAPVVDDLAVSLAILVQAVPHVKVVAWLLLLQPLQ